mgnify:CR=1 FL=1
MVNWYKWLDLVRGLVRPFIAVTGWSAFLFITVWAVLKHVDAGLARELTIGFLTAVSAIVGVWVGSRGKK